MNEQAASQGLQAGDTTAILSRRVRAGQEPAFQAWGRAFAEAMGTFPGFRDCRLVPPVPGGQAEWVFVVTFDGPATLRSWLDSEVRRAWLVRAEPMVEQSGPLQVVSGLETLFGLLPPSVARPPAVWKLAGVTLVALYPVALLNGWAVTPRLQGLPLPVRALVASAVTVAVMTWGVMPLATRAFKRWLYPAYRPPRTR
jgi:antibiotic biosynthesis monooxygenase (ABM) superfamily enzyme